ncbi:hypothetical protein BGX38DRAFT_1191067 [Terfezia claveryi]|nr:hypothetical protein BGX38DRAFT_1191067 [Terfezia claveryi]
MRYSSPSSSSSPDTHDYNNIPTTCFYHTSLYQTSSPAKLVLTPVILAPTTPAAANKITKRSAEKKSAEMRSCAGARCTLFKHSSSLSTGMREWDVDALGGTTGWFLQRLIEVATTGNELPTVPTERQMIGRREDKVGGMELDGDVDVDDVREQLERLKTVDAAERKDLQVVKAQAPGEEVLAMARTLENLTHPTPSLPLLDGNTNLLPPQPIKNPLRAVAKPYYPSSPVLSARRYSPSNSSHSSYPGYKGLSSSPGSGSGSGISRRLCVDRVDRGKDKERVYNGQYTWSGYSSDGSYDHAPASPSSPTSSSTTSSSYSSSQSYSQFPNSALYSPSSPSLSSSTLAPFPSSSKVQAGRIGKRRAASGGTGGSSGLNLSVSALASLGQVSGTGVMQMHMEMGVVVMGVRRVGRRAPSPEVQVAAAVERKDSGSCEMGMVDRGRKVVGMDNDDVVMIDGDMVMDGDWEL